MILKWIGKDGDNFMIKYTLRNEMEISNVENPFDRRMCSLDAYVHSDGFSTKELDTMAERINQAYGFFVRNCMSACSDKGGFQNIKEES